MVVVEKEQQINSNLSSFLGGGLGVGTLFALHPGPYLAIPTATQAQSGSFVVHFVGALQLPGLYTSSNEWLLLSVLSSIRHYTIETHYPQSACSAHVQASIGIRTSDHHCNMINSVLKLTLGCPTIYATSAAFGVRFEIFEVK
jgi:hypothetical protein